MAEYKTVVGRQLNNRWLLHDFDSGAFELECEDIIKNYDVDVFLTNAYWDTAENKLKGVCIDLDALPIVNAGKSTDYYVYVGTHEGSLWYVKPYGGCLSLSESINYFAESFSEFFTDNTVYGGVGDDDCYDFIWKLLYRNVSYRIPVGMNDWGNMGRSYSGCLGDIHGAEYVKMPFGITDFDFGSVYLYRNVLGALYLPKSLRYLNVDALIDAAEYACDKVVIPSSITDYRAGSLRRGTYDFYFECNPNSYLWDELANKGYERIMLPNYNI